MTNLEFHGDYVCVNCETTFKSPHHCGRPMIVVGLNDMSAWVCWKGEHAPCCGKPSVIPIEKCCENQELQARS